MMIERKFSKGAHRRMFLRGVNFGIIIFMLVLAIQGYFFFNNGSHEYSHENEWVTNPEIPFDNHGTRRNTAEEYDFTIICVNNSHITNGGLPTGYFIDIQNTGKFHDTYTFTKELVNVTGGDEPDPNEWSSKLAKTQVTLAPEESARIVLNVSTGCGCQLYTQAQIRVSAQSVNVPDNIKFIDTFTTRGPTIDVVKLELMNNLDFSDPVAGKELDFVLKVTNPQTVEQTYTASVEKKPEGWLVSYDVEPFIVNAYSSLNIEFSTTIPLESAPGEYVFKFKVQSVKDPYIAAELKVTEVKLLPELAIGEITFSDPTITPGQAVDIAVTIENLGAAYAQDFIVNVYDDSSRLLENLINQSTIEVLNGGQNIVKKYTWQPVFAGFYNITLFVNPTFYVEEVGNRYGNNLKTTMVDVRKEHENDNGDGVSGNDSTGSGAGANTDGLMVYIFAGVGVVVFIIAVVFFITRRKGSSGSDTEEKTAKKIPLRRGLQQSRPTGKKTARKVAVDESGGRKDKKRYGRYGSGSKSDSRSRSKSKYGSRSRERNRR